MNDNLTVCICRPVSRLGTSMEVDGDHWQAGIHLGLDG